MKAQAACYLTLKKYDVILDATFLTDERRNFFFDLTDRICIIFVDTPLHVCVDRQASRSGNAKVPAAVIREMQSSIQLPDGKLLLDSVATVEGGTVKVYAADEAFKACIVLNRISDMTKKMFV
jgi:predicted kinase